MNPKTLTERVQEAHDKLSQRYTDEYLRKGMMCCCDPFQEDRRLLDDLLAAANESDSLKAKLAQFERAVEYPSAIGVILDESVHQPVMVYERQRQVLIRLYDGTRVFVVPPKGDTK